MAKKLKEKISYIFYFPFDFPFVIEKVLSRLRPSLIILAETELWPNLLRYAQYSKIPVISTNGTISDTSFERYKRIRPIFKDVINKVSYFCMQTQRDKERLINLGVKPEKIIVTGNTKFDLLDADSVKEQPFENWNIKEFSPVIVAGSTHAGEEEFLIESFRAIVKKFPKALLILVPRHPDRVPEIENLIRAQRYSYRKRSEMSLFALEENIIIVDTIGELSKIYTSADIVFMGGSLVRIGGHNLLEPAFLAKPIITGPYTFKQNEMVELLKENDGIVQLESKEELKEKLLELLSSPEKRKKLGENAYKVALSNQGATRKNFEVIEKFLHKF